MARTVNADTDEGAGTLTIPVAPFSLAFYWKPNSPANNSFPFSWSVGAGTTMIFDFLTDTDRLRFNVGGGVQETLKASLTSQWYLVALVCAAANDWRGYMGVLGSGAQDKVTNTGSATPDGTGFRYPPGSGSASLGDYGPFAVWTAALTDEEVQSLIRGFHPTCIRLSALRESWGYAGDLSPEPGIRGLATIAVTSMTKTDHPPLLYPIGAHP